MLCMAAVLGGCPSREAGCTLGGLRRCAAYLFSTLSERCCLPPRGVDRVASVLAPHRHTLPPPQQQPPVRERDHRRMDSLQRSPAAKPRPPHIHPPPVATPLQRRSPPTARTISQQGHAARDTLTIGYAATDRAACRAGFKSQMVWSHGRGRRDEEGRARASVQRRPSISSAWFTWHAQYGLVMVQQQRGL